MNQPEVVVVIAQDGGITLDVNGVQGSSCVELTKKLEELLGTVERSQEKTEYYVRPQKTKLSHKHDG